MKITRRLITITIVLALTVSVGLSTVSVKRAHAYAGGGEGAIAVGIILLWVTYVTAKGLICTPVAAINASRHETDFGGAFKACWDGKSLGDETDKTENAAPAESPAVIEMAAEEPEADPQTETATNEPTGLTVAAGSD